MQEIVNFNFHPKNQLTSSKVEDEKKQEDGDGDHEHVHEEQLGVEALVEFDNLLKQKNAALKLQYSSLGRLFAKSNEIKISGAFYDCRQLFKL